MRRPQRKPPRMLRDNLSEIVVTGVRMSLKDSTHQRNSDRIADNITTAEIG